MKLTLIRYNHDKESTQGILAVDGKFQCHTLEDQRQAVKVSGETRIPDGTYAIGWRNALTPMTERYQKRFSWFYRHLHLKNVPGFTNIYLHIGNTDADTDGCILVADTVFNDPNHYNSTLGKSTQAFTRLYGKIGLALNHGEEVTIEIKSIWE